MTDGNSKYQNFGQVGSMGDNAHVEIITQTQGSPTSTPLNYSLLLEQLATLRQAIDSFENVSSDEKEQAIVAIQEAQEAARKVDPSGVRAGLRKTGKWVIGVAEKIGVSLLANQLKDAWL